MTDEMKPCKRCGSVGIPKEHTYHREGSVEYWIHCANRFCDEETGSFGTPEEALAQWNEPTEEQRLRAEIESLTNEITRLRMVIDHAAQAMIEFSEVLNSIKGQKP